MPRLQRGREARRRRRARTRRRRSCPRAKLRPVGPSTTTMPPVMYSQPWSPTPSTTAMRAAVAHREPLARRAGEERLAARRAVEHVLPTMTFSCGVEGRARAAARTTSDAAREPLADVVVRVALELERHAARRERAEALARRAGELRRRWCPSGRPVAAVLRAISPASIAPNARSRLRDLAAAIATGSPCSSAGARASMSLVGRATAARPWSCARSTRRRALRCAGDRAA